MKDFKKYFIIPATPQEVYRALVNPFAIQNWTGEVAVMQEEPDSEFSIFGGDIVGKNLRFETDKLIEQQWFFGDHEDSVVLIKLHPHGEHCSLELRHHNIPDEDFEDIVIGWNEVYMVALID